MADKVKTKFSFSMFLIKITSRAFWVWLITTAIVSYVLYRILESRNPSVFTWMAIHPAWDLGRDGGAIYRRQRPH